jgi:hypothetical protein
LLLGRGDGLNHLRRNRQSPDHLIVEHTYTTRRDGAQGKFLISGYPQFAHEENIERDVERLGHLKGDGHPAAR